MSKQTTNNDINPKIPNVSDLNYNTIESYSRSQSSLKVSKNDENSSLKNTKRNSKGKLIKKSKNLKPSKLIKKSSKKRSLKTSNNNSTNKNNKISIDKYNKLNSNDQAKLIAEFLEKVPLLARLSHKDRLDLGRSFEQKVFKPGEVVIKQGDIGKDFYIITKGQANVIISNDDKKTSDIVATLFPGDYFGETALLTNKRRNATIKARKIKLYTLSLDKNTFTSVFGRERIKVNFGKRGVKFSKIYNNIKLYF